MFWVGALMASVVGWAELLSPLPERVDYDRPKALLGKKIFFEPGLSRDGTIACVTCHHLPGSGADTLPYSIGIRKSEGDINTPTVLNARFHFAQMWDGRAKTLEDQIILPITNPKEMGSSMGRASAYLRSRPDYVSEFAKIYPEGITPHTMADAIVEFEKALVTKHSRFDRYLNGEVGVLRPLEKRGYRLFKDYGCISCHNGIAIGGNMYQKIGIFAPYYSDKDQLGRYDITQREKDRYVFKVPSLRNVAMTAPYMHDGKVATLREAIVVMGINQLGVEFSAEELDALEAFLHTLSGETPAILRMDK